MGDEGDVLVVRRGCKFRGVAGQCQDTLGIDLLVGVDLDRQLARAAAVRGRDVQVRAALVDDPLAVAANAGPTNGILRVRG